MVLKPIALGLLLLCGSLGLASAADEPSASHLTAARDLAVVTGAVSTLDNVIPALVDEVRRQGVTRPEMAKDLDEVLKALTPELEQQRQQAITLAARSYAKFLSENEINQVITFFKTPVGAKYVRTQPEITDDIVNNLTAWSQLVSEYVQTRVRSEMLKRGHQMQ